MTDIAAYPHSMTRIEIETGIEFDAFKAAFEREVPPLDPAVFSRLDTWDEVVTALDGYAPHGLMVFTSIDAGQLLRLAGHDRPCIEYLVGNQTVAERMYRYEQATLLYAPLRILLTADVRGNATFIIDQPSTVFGGLDDERVAQVGRELDKKVAAALSAAGVDDTSAFAT